MFSRGVWCRGWPALLCAVGLLLPCVSGAAPFRIQKSVVAGEELVVFHDVPADALQGDSALLTVGGKPCAVLAGEALRPERGGEALTLMFVMDRGGTAYGGMGRYSKEMVGVIKAQVAIASKRAPSTQFAMVDAPGKGAGFSELRPTTDVNEVNAFLDSLPAPAGAGADVYGATLHALGVLKRSPGRLRGILMISDGIDPLSSGEESAQNTQAELLGEAKKSGVIINAIHWNRRGERGVSKQRAAVMQQGLRRLRGVVNGTGGELRIVNAPNDTARQLNDRLTEFGSSYLKLFRTRCRLCGSFASTEGQVIDMRIRRGTRTVGRSQAQPAPTAPLTRRDYGACSTEVKATVDEAEVPTELEEAAPAGEGDTKKEGKGGKVAPIVAGVVALLLLGVGALVWRRKQKAAAAEAAAQADKITADREAAAAAREQALRDELEQARHVEPPAPVVEPESMAAPTPAAAPSAPAPASFVLRATAASQMPVEMALTEGRHQVGSAPPADLLIDYQTVSGDHAELIVRGGFVSVRDLRSSNGTFVNGMQLEAGEEAEVRVGDEIGFSRRVVVRLEAGAKTEHRGGRARTRLDV